MKKSPPAKLAAIRRVPVPPARAHDGHKGTFGTVIIVGGSPTMIGAPALAASAALRAGAGLVKIAAVEAIIPHALTIEPCATGIALDPRRPALAIDAINEIDPGKRAVLAIGPGLGRSPFTKPLVAALLRDARARVLDADALNLLAALPLGSIAGAHAPRVVLTPHPGEFARLAKPLGIALSATDPHERPRAATALARAHHAVVVLKGHRTIVTDGRRCFTNTTGNPAMATAGSGDILTGLIAALLAQGMPALDAAILGVHAHGRAGDNWAQRHGPAGLKATDLADEIPDAVNALRRRR